MLSWFFGADYGVSTAKSTKQGAQGASRRTTRCDHATPRERTRMTRREHPRARAPIRKKSVSKRDIRGSEPTFAPKRSLLRMDLLRKRIKFSHGENLRGSRRTVCTKKTRTEKAVLAFFGADYGARTRHLDLGKVALYQMS